MFVVVALAFDRKCCIECAHLLYTLQQYTRTSRSDYTTAARVSKLREVHAPAVYSLGHGFCLMFTAETVQSGNERTHAFLHLPLTLSSSPREPANCSQLLAPPRSVGYRVHSSKVLPSAPR